MLTKILQKFFPDSWFTKFWSNPRLRGIVVLLLWFVIIGIIYAAFISPYDNKDYNNVTIIEEETALYEDLKNNLLKNNFTFNYTFLENGNKTYYKGSSLENEKLIYVENNLGIKQYYLKNGEIYSVNMGELTLTNDFALSDYFDLNYVFSLVNNIEPDETENEFIFKNDSIYVKMSIENNNFNKIELNINDNEYIYEFKNIGKVENISY